MVIDAPTRGPPRSTASTAGPLLPAVVFDCLHPPASSSLYLYMCVYVCVNVCPNDNDGPQGRQRCRKRYRGSYCVAVYVFANVCPNEYSEHQVPRSILPLHRGYQTFRRNRLLE